MKDAGTVLVRIEMLKREAREHRGRKRQRGGGGAVEEKQLLVGFPFIPAIMASRYTSISNYSKKPLHQ